MISYAFVEVSVLSPLGKDFIEGVHYSREKKLILYISFE